MKVRMRTVALALTCAVLLAFAAPALAASPAQTAYGSVNTQQKVENVNGTLPFTGINAGLVACIGIALVGAGAFVRRASRTQ